MLHERNTALQSGPRAWGAQNKAVPGESGPAVATDKTVRLDSECMAAGFCKKGGNGHRRASTACILIDDNQLQVCATTLRGWAVLRLRHTQES